MVKNIFGKAALLAATGLAMSAMMPATASAAPITITTVGNDSSTSGNAGNSRTFSNSGVSVIASAYSVSGTSLLSAHLGVYDQGLGVTACSTGQTYCSTSGDSSHTIDNSGRDDFVLLQFSTDVIVTDLVFGYVNGGVDYSFSVADTNVSPFTLTSYSNYQSMFLPVTTKTGNNDSSPTIANSEAGNLFLIGAAFDPATGNDSFKLKSVTFTKAPAVPEPATWAMMIAGIGAVGVSMRRRKTAISFA
jgi:hypothetical protein